MSVGEFDSPSRPASEAYRDGWERTFVAIDNGPGKKHGLERADFDVNGCAVYIDHDAAAPSIVWYANGCCPVLSDE